MRYFIVDDDAASRRMLKTIILEEEMGVIVGEADSGESAIQKIIASDPDVVLMDLLMPHLDGIETIDELQKHGFKGTFIMLSQVVNKEMVGEAYEKGVEFFIHKPINRIEVYSILKRTSENLILKQSLMTIRKSIMNFEESTNTENYRNLKDIALSILNDMGIVGEVGTDDIVNMLTYLAEQEEHSMQLPPLKELYEAVARKTKIDPLEILKESKAIEQRIRRTVGAAMNNIATLGVVDYTNPEFEYYAPRYFEFSEIRTVMKAIQDETTPKKVKINVKKFLQVLYIESNEKFNNNSSKM